MSKSIAIIGGGIAGLSAGIYARMNGFEVDIFEMHSMAGGLCTGWKRKDYTFDGCIHWLTGSSPSSSYYRLWEEIGAIQGKQFFNWDYHSKFMLDDGRILTFYTDPDKLEKELISLAPEDTKAIKELIGDMRKFMKHEIPPDIKISDIFKLLSTIRLVYKYRLTGKELSEKFTNPSVKKLIANLDWHGMMVAFTLWGISLMASGNGGYPLGGSLGFIQSVLNRYLSLGGRINYHSKVDKILVNGNKASGILLSDGEIKMADTIISAADGYSTIFEWLEGKFINEKIVRLYHDLKPFPSLIYVSLGIHGEYPNIPHSLTFPVTQAFQAGSKEVNSLTFKNYSFDKSIAPAGKSVFCFMIENDFEYWKKIKGDREQYQREKNLIGELVVDALTAVFPEIKSHVDVVDVATPCTFHRYTGNWKGSYEGWLLTKNAITKQFPQTLPGLSNFYMVGQWVSPGGGLPTGVITAKAAIKKICKSEKRPFASFTGQSPE
jgi:phytoene dehydrogenase-like protein